MILVAAAGVMRGDGFARWFHNGTPDVFCCSARRDHRLWRCICIGLKIANVAAPGAMRGHRLSKTGSRREPVFSGLQRPVRSAVTGSRLPLKD